MDDTVLPTVSTGVMGICFDRLDAGAFVGSNDRLDADAVVCSKDRLDADAFVGSNDRLDADAVAVSNDIPDGIGWGCLNGGRVVAPT